MGIAEDRERGMVKNPNLIRAVKDRWLRRDVYADIKTHEKEINE